MVSSLSRYRIPVGKNKRKKTIMREATLLEALDQVGSEEAGAIFRDFIHEAVRSSFIDVMLKEVEALCGPSYRPLAGNQAYRSGTAPGVCILEGCSERVLRPRVRRKTSAGGSKEMGKISPFFGVELLADLGYKYCLSCIINL